MTSVSVVVPVKDGEQYLEELLAALATEGVDEVLVIDSGSRDRSVEIARAAGARLIEIPPSEFGHGRTRNLGAEETRGELICFLTQDATPIAGWLAAYLEAFAVGPNVGVAFGPHFPRSDTSPMIARELEDFFRAFSPDGKLAVQVGGDSPFLSNVNACYARECWRQIRFRDLRYAEDQAFGVDLMAAGWRKVYHPGAGVLHAHNYDYAGFMRRYFDEYRGLLDTTGHIEPIAGSLRHVAASVASDLRWMRKQRMSRSERLRWSTRAAAHHGGRRVFAALGSRADRLPAGMQRALSLEDHDGIVVRAPKPARPPAGTPDPPRSPLGPGAAVPRIRERDDYAVAADVWRDGPAPLLDPSPGMADRDRLRVAMLVPPFSRGSGGHNTLFQMFSRLERRGHVCTVWVHDYYGEVRDVWPAVLRRNIVDYFAPIQGSVYKGFDHWQGADVVIATGWQTVHPALRLDRSFARMYIVNDHEPEFYAASTERVLAADTYGHGLHCLAASPWLRDLLIERYGASAEAFQLGVDDETYRPRPTHRRRDTIVYYARYETPRRAVPIGLMALAELHRRRPDTRILLFGSQHPIYTAFPYVHMGILSPKQLSWLYSHATVGLCLSLTNFSLMPKEMFACGLPCVELSGVSAESIFGESGPLELAPIDPIAIADCLERLLDDRELWETRSRDGIDFVATHTWDHATDELEQGLRRALQLREAAVLERG